MMPLSWVERIWSSIADRGEAFAEVLRPENAAKPLDAASNYARALLTERGDASGAAIARELLAVMTTFDGEQSIAFCRFLAENFHPDGELLRRAAELYLADPTQERAAEVAAAAEPERQELIRRMNIAPGGTSALVQMRKRILSHRGESIALRALDFDLRHLFTSWFNPGFLELRRIDWGTPAATLEKLIAYEAVHAIDGWEDLRRRLARDRRCFGFFHPALPGEPLIFVEVALTSGLAPSIQPLLEKTDDVASQRDNESNADTAIFYSISNCQDGLRGISFGNFLIKQVVEELRAELPRLVRFSTLSPVPGFRPWFAKRLDQGGLDTVLTMSERASLRSTVGVRHGGDPVPSLEDRIKEDLSLQYPTLLEELRTPLTRLCASYLISLSDEKSPLDPVARFHLSNGARLERINWKGNVGARGSKESFGMMVNYLYKPEDIEANHESLVRGIVVRSQAVEALLDTPDSTASEMLREGRLRKKKLVHSH